MGQMQRIRTPICTKYILTSRTGFLLLLRPSQFAYFPPPPPPMSQFSHCTVLYCTVLYYTVMYSRTAFLLLLLLLLCHNFPTVLYCTVLYYTVMYSRTGIPPTTSSQFSHCTTLYCTVLYYTVMYSRTGFLLLLRHNFPTPLKII